MVLGSEQAKILCLDGGMQRRVKNTQKVQPVKWEENHKDVGRGGMKPKNAETPCLWKNQTKPKQKKSKNPDL